MKIETLIKNLETALLARNWRLLARNKRYVTYSNDLLFDTPITFNIPTDKKAPDFPLQFLHNIEILKEIEDFWKNDKQVQYSIDYIKRYKLHLSKTKKDWIIPEPNSNYNDNEIPDIYIP